MFFQNQIVNVVHTDQMQATSYQMLIFKRRANTGEHQAKPSLNDK